MRLPVLKHHDVRTGKGTETRKTSCTVGSAEMELKKKFTSTDMVSFQHAVLSHRLESSALSQATYLLKYCYMALAFNLG